MVVVRVDVFQVRHSLEMEVSAQAEVVVLHEKLDRMGEEVTWEDFLARTLKMAVEIQI